MKKHLLLFAALLLPWMVKAQSIEVSTDHLLIEYAEGHGPSIQPFIVTYEGLRDDLHVSFSNQLDLKFQLSKRQNEGYEDSISFTLDELALENQVEIFVRMNENLETNTYGDTIVIASAGAETKVVSCSGIVNGAVTTLSFTLPDGTYQGQQRVSINCDTEGAKIHYTTNGENPNENSTVYELNEEILIERTTILKAIGIKENWNNSAIVSATYHINGNIVCDVYPLEGGSVTIGGSQEIGQTATLTPIPKDCYHFKQWTDGTTDNPLMFIVGENNNYTAIFEPNNYTITGNSNDDELGSVTGGGINFHCEDIATLVAIPAEGYEFEKWDDGNTDNPRQIVVNGDATYTAEFAAKRTNIIVIANPREGGEVAGGGSYSFWDWCTVTAQANEGYSFINWTEDNDTISTNPIYSFQIELSFGTNERILVANFAQIPIVGTIETPETICDNEPLDLVVPAYNNAIGGEWQLSPDTTFSYIEKYIIGDPLSQNYNGWKLRYIAYNETDTIPSNMVTISVQSYITEEEASHLLVAKGPERGKYVLIYPNPKEGYKYQWYRDSTPIANANKQYYYEQGGLTNGDYRVYISYTEDGICGAFSPTKTISGNGSATFSIYPNPAHTNDNLIVVNSSEGEAQFALYSIDGRLLHSQMVTDSQTTIEIHLSQGIYVAYFSDKTGFVKVEKIVIQ